MLYAWELYARDDQLPPAGGWRVWYMEAGRRAGKTRAASEWIHRRVERREAQRIGLLGRTPADVRDVMIEGESGLLATAKPWFKPYYEPTRRRVTWPRPRARAGSARIVVGGEAATARGFSAQQPEEPRGHQHDTAWIDEVAAFPGPEAVDNLLMGLSGGRDARAVATSTPRPVGWLREFRSREGVVITKATTYDNLHNLGAGYQEVVARYKGTRLEKQELLGEFLEGVEGALVQYEEIARTRVEVPSKLQRVVVGVDPAASTGQRADETGIAVAGLGFDGHVYLLRDASAKLAPSAWAERVCQLFAEYDADRVVAEKNMGGDMVRQTLQTQNEALPVKLVTATRGKTVRAEPVAALYAQNRAHHVGEYPELEDQMLGFSFAGYGRSGSPDRAEAWIWAVHELVFARRGLGRLTWGR